MKIQEHAWTIAKAVEASIVDGEYDELSKITIAQLRRIKDIVENETYEYLNQLKEDGKLQIGN